MAFILWLSGCSILVGQRELEIPLAQMQQAMDKKFPLKNRYMEFFDISLTHPRLTLQPDTNRITTTLDAVAAPFFLKKEWKGSMSFSGSLQFDAAKNAIVLADIHIENMNLADADAVNTKAWEKVGRLLAEQTLKEVALYTFKPTESHYGGINFVIVKIVTKPDALVVIFEPAK